MPHVVLLGDSIFDNGRYVPFGPSVIAHLRKDLPPGWEATLLALDGDVVDGVACQMSRMPDDASHLVVSVGGNDALGHSATILDREARSSVEVLARFEAIRDDFRSRYRRMLDAVLATGKPVAVCTVYDAIPGLGPAERAGLALFNEVILFEAARARIPLIDLRIICDEPGDYSSLSPIEPSASGGGKIARMIRRVVGEHDFSTPACRVYA